ncbi:MAG: hypothetical protein NUV46_00920 [Nanoarchaeota archaeon]|nr:hypothetical protein [Nanoarchaeota archaeon]
MKKFVLITFVFITTINFILAGNISLSYPQEVEVGEEFTITLSMIDFPEGGYDIKFDTHNSMGENLFRIFDGTTWKSSNYYINNIISNNEEKDFLVKVLEYEGNIDFRIRIRKTGASAVFLDFEGCSITSIQSSGGGGSGTNNNSSTTNNNNTNSDPEEEEEENEEEDYIKKLSSNIPLEKEVKEANLTPINLNPKNIKSSESKENSGSVDYSKYSLVAFCILLLFLYIIKPKNKKNEFKT